MGVEDYTKWAHAIAHGMAPGSPDHDDLVQEALLGVAMAMRDKPDASAKYYAVAGKNNVRSALRDDRFTGAPSRRGGNVTDEVLVEGVDSLEALYETPALDKHAVLDEAGYEKVEWELLRPVIREAVSTLKPSDQDYVNRRFAGERDVEIGVARGVKGKVLSNRWGSVIRPHLANKLRDLEGLL